MTDALSIIRDEHRRFALVLRQLEDAVENDHSGDADPSFEIFHAIIEYIESFVDTFHHMKEDLYLFPALYRRFPEVSAVLDLLHEEHRRGGVLVSDLKAALAEYEKYGSAAYLDFREAARSYIAMERDHIETEESQVLPLARAHLTSDDHRLLDETFADNDDPIFGDRPKQRLRRLHARLANAAPTGDSTG